MNSFNSELNQPIDVILGRQKEDTGYQCTACRAIAGRGFNSMVSQKQDHIRLNEHYIQCFWWPVALRWSTNHPMRWYSRYWLLCSYRNHQYHNRPGGEDCNAVTQRIWRTGKAATQANKTQEAINAALIKSKISHLLGFHCIGILPRERQVGDRDILQNQVEHSCALGKYPANIFRN